jgi:hypothetical protein
VSERPTSDTDGQDAAVNAAWRRNSDERPSPAVDEAIRAAARRRVASRPRGDECAGKSAERSAAKSPARWRRSTRWVPVAAAAGVAVLAFGLLRWLPVEQQFTPSAPASPAAKAETASDSAASESAPAHAAPRADTTPLADEPASAMRQGAVPPQPPTDFAAPQKQTPQASVQERRELPSVSAPTGANAAAAQSADTHDAGARASAPETTTSITSARPAAREVTTEQVRVEQIAEFYAAGRLDAAAAALRDLRRTNPHADERLPEELRSWAATVRD